MMAPSLRYKVISQTCDVVCVCVRSFFLAKKKRSQLRSQLRPSRFRTLTGWNHPHWGWPVLTRYFSVHGSPPLLTQLAKTTIAHPWELPAWEWRGLGSQGRHIASESKVWCTITRDISFRWLLCVHGQTQGCRQCTFVTAAMRLPVLWNPVKTAQYALNHSV